MKRWMIFVWAIWMAGAVVFGGTTEERWQAAAEKWRSGNRDAAVQEAVALNAERELANPARLQLVEWQLQTANPDEADALLATIKPNGEQEARLRDYDIAWSLFLRGEFQQTIDGLQSLCARPAPWNCDFLTAVVRMQAAALNAAHRERDSVTVLLDFAQSPEGSPAAAEVFAMLEEMESQGIDVRWRDWNSLVTPAASPAFRSACLLAFGRVALKNGRPEEARKAWETLRTQKSADTEWVEAMIGLANLEAGKPSGGEALPILREALEKSDPSQRDRIWGEMARFDFLAGQFAAARKISLELADQGGPAAGNALANAALAALAAGNSADFESDLAKIESKWPGNKTLETLRLEKGLCIAAADPAKGKAGLDALAHSETVSEGVRADAEFALAEIALLTGEEGLMPISDAPSVPADRMAWLQIWGERRDGAAPEKVIALCEGFLKDHPHSNLESDVRMLMGETWFREANYPKAREQFEWVAAKEKEKPAGELALYLGGLAAMRSMDARAVDEAVILFEQVYRRGGSLCFEARLEQASAKMNLGREEEALAIYEDLLKGEIDRPIRLRALTGKGQACHALGADHVENYARAVSAFDEILAVEDLPVSLRNEILTRKGKALEKMGKVSEAIGVYDLVMSGTMSRSEPEYLWFYRAGFDEARLLEEKMDWAAAAKVYERLARVPGARAPEAEERLKRLRLEHFLWE